MERHRTMIQSFYFTSNSDKQIKKHKFILVQMIYEVLCLNWLYANNFPLVPTSDCGGFGLTS